jgi:hypothetical protein
MRRLWGAMVICAALATPALADSGANPGDSRGNPGAFTSDGNNSGTTPGATQADLVTASVRAGLAGDRVLRGSVITVATSDTGVVTLVGSVPNNFARNAANDIARAMPGVAMVNNQLRLLIQAPNAPAPP